MILRTFLFIFSLGFLTACGGSGGDNPTSTATPEPTQSPEPTQEPTPDPTATPTPTPTPTAEVGPNFTRGTVGEMDTVPTIACDSVFSSTSALESAATTSLTAGTTLCLADGDYTNLELDFGGVGTEENPIKVAAENSGGATIGGEVLVRMSGEYVMLQGLIFKDGQSQSSDFLQTRGNDRTPCNYCRITEIAIIDFDQGNEDSGKWLNIYGHHNRIDHSWFTGKTNKGALLVINREVPDGASAADTEIDYARIDHNYFGDRPPAGGRAYALSSDNEYEAIRVGTSDSHSADSFTVVAHNYFERIQGEAEVISNKSGNNTYFNNTIRDSYGSLTTRHGSSATISHNFIIGDDHPFAAGIRVIDDGHRIVNNYIEGARYLSTRFHGGIVIHNSDGSTTNGYQQVENVLIAHNTIFDSVNSLNVNGGNQSRNPRDVIFVNNIIDDAIGPIITQAQEGMPESSTIDGNYFSGQSFSDDDGLTTVNGISLTDAMLEEDGLGISRPTSSSPNLEAASVVLDGFDAVTDDMDGHTRISPTSSGSDQSSAATATLGLLNSYDVGPINYRPDMSSLGLTKVSLLNHDFDNGTNGWNLINAEITTENDEVFSRGSSLRVASADGRASQSVSLEANTDYTLSAFIRGQSSIGVDLDGSVSKADQNTSSSYKFTQVTFNSGSNTSATIFASLDDSVQNSENIIDHDFDDFSGQDGVDAWSIVEGSTIGQVQSSSNSADGADGSVKFKYNSVDEEGGTPSISQVLTGLLPNTEYTLSAYVLEKNDSPVTVTMGVFEGETTNVLTSKVMDYSALESSDAPEGDDSFLQDSLTFNSGSNTTVTIFAQYNANTIISSGGSSGDTEIRVDEFSLTYEGPPADGTVGIFDSFRLVRHPEN